MNGIIDQIRESFRDSIPQLLDAVRLLCNCFKHRVSPFCAVSFYFGQGQKIGRRPSDFSFTSSFTHWLIARYQVSTLFYLPDASGVTALSCAWCQLFFLSMMLSVVSAHCRQ